MAIVGGLPMPYIQEEGERRESRRLFWRFLQKFHYYEDVNEYKADERSDPEQQAAALCHVYRCEGENSEECHN